MAELLDQFCEPGPKIIELKPKQQKKIITWFVGRKELVDHNLTECQKILTQLNEDEKDKQPPKKFLARIARGLRYDQRPDLQVYIHEEEVQRRTLNAILMEIPDGRVGKAQQFLESEIGHSLEYLVAAGLNSDVASADVINEAVVNAVDEISILKIIDPKAGQRCWRNLGRVIHFTFPLRYDWSAEGYDGL